MRRIGHVEGRLGEGEGHEEGLLPLIATAEVERHKSWLENIWGFPEMEVPLVILHFNGIFP